MSADAAGPAGSELSEELGLAAEARACARHCKEGAWSPNVLQNEQGTRLKSAQVLEAAAAEIERLRAELATERGRWRALLSDARPWLGQAPDSPETLGDLNALMRRVAEACSLWHEPWA